MALVGNDSGAVGGRNQFVMIPLGLLLTCVSLAVVRSVYRRTSEEFIQVEPPPDAACRSDFPNGRHR